MIWNDMLNVFRWIKLLVYARIVLNDICVDWLIMFTGIFQTCMELC